MMRNVARFLKSRDDGKFKAVLTDLFTTAQERKISKEQIDEEIRNQIAELTDGEHDHVGCSCLPLTELGFF